MSLTIVECLKSKQQEGIVSFLDRLFGFEEEPRSDKRLSDDAQIVHAESMLSSVSPEELSIIESSTSYSITLGVEQQMGAALNTLVPLVTNVGQTVSTFDMAMVKFPEGVGWADLCVRHKDGWNILSNFLAADSTRRMSPMSHVISILRWMHTNMHHFLTDV